ncbi:MAG TPA: STAS domain-containing protein [Candidatus Omnitrophota bacterium]|nr:STAS domain-containing protein [Candidatus Omnitrophota bacterium]HQJ14910.1 STAS domain-containing protein [Candidatus Omnitrophota bacterium]
MALELSVYRKEDENVVIIKMKGQLDTETHTQLLDKAKQLITKSVTGMILDLEGLEYVSSMGISAILMIRKMFEEKNASFVMVNMPVQIVKVFEIVQALPDVRIFESMEEADRYFMEIQQRAKEGGR